MISMDEALNIILSETKLLSLKSVDLLSSLNKVLAEDVYSKDTLPPFDKSAMDGYAIKSDDTIKGEDTACSHVDLEIKGVIKAGDYYEEALQDGEALKIMTGAALPNGADAVIQIEKVEAKENKLYIYEPVKKGTNIIKLGEEIKAGDLALQRGTLITPAVIGFLASLGYASVNIYKAPKIILVITGDELLDISDELQKGKIRNSNEYSLTALVKNLGAEVVSLGIIPDEKEVVREKVKYALQNGDIVISSGGASVGDYDFIEDVLKEIGADIKFTSVAVKPGKPVNFAVYSKKLFFGLPGNPSSVINTFQEFVKPAIEKMMGKEQANEELFPVILKDNFKGKEGRIKYVYVCLEKENGKYYAYDIGSQCSNHLMTMSKANGVIIVPKEIGTVKAGEILNGKFIFK